MDKKNKPLKFPKLLLCILVPITALLLVVAIVADVIIKDYWEIIAAAFSEEITLTNPELKDEAFAESRAVTAEVLEEGSVLLKNDGDVLPIASDKVNIYGIISGNMYLNTKGSGAVNNSDSVSLKEALEDVGYEVNSSIWNLVATRAAAATTGTSGAGAIKEGAITESGVTEISLDSYNSAMSWGDAKAYSDYAIVTFGRVGSEGGDLGRSYLTLGDSEVQLLQKLNSEGFKVITLINSSHVMELGPVIQYSDAILWIGGPGVTGLQGVARVLSGEVSPSGRLVDTWMYDQKTSSTYYTAAGGTYSGAASGAFMNFNEGIYVGYRWYETADAVGYWNNINNTYGTGYSGVVAYPFGYGLSYGELTEEIVGTPAYDSEENAYTFTVKATNANDVPAKDVFELYVEKPYTEGGVEVSKVELIGFAKSEAITNADEDGYTTTITVAVDDLASYDVTANNGKGAYVLAAGDYTFYLASGKTGAHCWTLGDDSRTWSFQVDEDIVYSGDNARSTDLVAAENQLGADNNKLALDDNNAGYVALSRAGGFANAKTAIFTEMKNVTLTADDTMTNLLKNYTDYGEYQGEILDNLSTSQKKKYSFADLYTTDADGNPLAEIEVDEETGDLISKTIVGEVDYDDERWDYLISQMSVDEMEVLIGQGGWMTAKVDSIDKAKTVDYDGPSGLSNLMKATLGLETNATSFCSEPVMASTWNTELIEKLGRAVGKEANVTGQSGWYAPGANIHRSPFGGRNAEYYSEDAYMSGVMCAAESGGALSMGLYCVAKHFAFNDVEAGRLNMQNCWLSEQAAREIYLKAYEIGCKSGDVPALMASYMWTNGGWIGGDYGLLTGIVRNEWGFKGFITCDNAQGGSYKWMSASSMIYAGGDMILSNPRVKLASDIKNSDEGISAMKTACKHILYTVARAYLNRIVAAEVGENTFVPIYIAINVVLYAGAAACAIACVTKVSIYFVKKKKLQGIEPVPEQD